MEILIRLENVSKRYRSGVYSEIWPLNGVTLRMGIGERIVLLGKSGSGKTTFLNLVGGVDKPDSGKLFVGDEEISAMSPGALAQYRRKDVGFIFQSFNLFPTLTVGENLMLPLDLLKDSDNAKARRMLASVGLEAHWDKFPEQLSGGEQQRVAIARALVKEPRIILADEPTGNLDLVTGNAILELIDETCRARNATLIMATHSSEALWIADRIFRLKSGAIEEAVGDHGFSAISAQPPSPDLP